MKKETKTLDERFDEKFKIFEQVSGDNGEEVEGFFAIEEDREKVKKFIHKELDDLAQQFLEAIVNKRIPITEEETVLENFGISRESNIMTEGYNIITEGYNQAIREIKKNFKKIIKDL